MIGMFFPFKNMIDSMDKMEKAALDLGLLPFFANNIRGFSIEEKTSPKYLFGDDYEDCWSWKGPVIGRMNLAYGKFFRRKAGFVSRELLPHFINYRRAKYPIKPYSTDEMLLDIIRENDSLSSTELKKYIFGSRSSKREWDEPVDRSDFVPAKKGSLEGALQRLQMSGHICITDFKYKISKKGDRYGWGVAVYSTPEVWFGEPDLKARVSPEESFKILVDHLSKKLRWASKKEIIRLIE